MAKRYNTFGEFTSDLHKARSLFVKNQRKLVLRSVREYKALIKNQIGHYITESYGPYQPWISLAESTKRIRAKRGFPADEPYLRTGSFRDSIHSYTNQKNRGVVGSSDKRASIFELGAGNIPPRPLFGPLMWLYGTKYLKKNVYHVLGDTFSKHTEMSEDGEE